MFFFFFISIQVISTVEVNGVCRDVNMPPECCCRGYSPEILTFEQLQPHAHLSGSGVFSNKTHPVVDITGWSSFVNHRLLAATLTLIAQK